MEGKTRKIQRTYKFRIYPTKKQEKKLLWTLEKCRYVYNYLLQELRNQKIIDKARLQEMITDLRRVEPELKNIYSKVLQMEHKKLFSNLKAITQLKKNGKKIGKLRFKSKGSFKTFTYNQSGFKIIDKEIRYDKLHLSKIGDIPFVKHRKIEGKIKQIIIKKYSSGKWFACVVSEIKQTIQTTENKKKVGIDLGITNYIYDSDGKRFNHPKNLKKSLKKLKKEQKRLARKKKSSKNRKKQKKKVAKIHEKILNQRNDFLHKLSRHYVENYGFIAVEDLNVKGIISISYNARNVMDAGWSRFLGMLEYKAGRAGVQIEKVNPNGTTQICSNCGRRVHKKLKDRKHICECGLEIDRDYNSAINILKKGLRQGLPEYTPVEIPVGESRKQDAQQNNSMTRRSSVCCNAG